MKRKLEHINFEHEEIKKSFIFMTNFVSSIDYNGLIKHLLSFSGSATMSVQILIHDELKSEHVLRLI